MSKQPTPAIKKHNGRVVIRSVRDFNSYWQCGQWVDGIENATKYANEEQAEFVVGLRNLRNVEVLTHIAA